MQSWKSWKALLLGGNRVGTHYLSAPPPGFGRNRLKLIPGNRLFIQNGFGCFFFASESLRANWNLWRVAEALRGPRQWINIYFYGSFFFGLTPSVWARFLACIFFAENKNKLLLKSEKVGPMTSAWTFNEQLWKIGGIFFKNPKSNSKRCSSPKLSMRSSLV